MKTVTILLAALLGSAEAQAAGPGPGAVFVQSFQVSGNGCPAGSTAVNVAPDAGAFTVLFAHYLAEAGNQIGRPSEWKSCLLDVTFVMPPGWTFTLDSVDYRGFASLGSGTLAQQVSTLSYPPRATFTRLAQLDLTGPRVVDYEHHVAVPPLYRVTAPCTGATRRVQLRINTGVSSRSGAPALMTVDSVDGALTQSYRFGWRSCGR